MLRAPCVRTVRADAGQGVRIERPRVLPRQASTRDAAARTTRRRGPLFRHIYELESQPADVRHAIRQNDCNLRVARVDVGVEPRDDFKEQLLQVIAFTRVRRLDFL